MIFDHIAVHARDTQASKAFFSAPLARLGVALVTEAHRSLGDGKPGCRFGAGGKEHAPAGIGAIGHPDDDDCGAFVIGPDGRNSAAVCAIAET